MSEETYLVPDPIELGEARAERFEERVRGDIYLCSCGRQCKLHEAEIITPDPYGEPFCPQCFDEWSHRQVAEEVVGPEGKP